MEALLFDLDGVVVDSERYWVEIAPTVMDHAIEEDPRYAEIDAADFAGRDVRESYRALTADADATVDISEQEYRTMYGRFAPEVYDRAELIDGFRDETARLREHGVKTGLVSGSYWVDQVIEEAGIGDALDVVVATPDRDLPGKPAPDGYHAAADELDVDPADCVAVEDSEAGIRAARDAGMTVIAYGDTPRQDHTAADVAVGTPDGLWNEVRARMD